MIFAIHGKPWITYRIGDTVLTADGIKGIVTRRYRKGEGRHGQTYLDVACADGTVHSVKERSIKGVVNEDCIVSKRMEE